MKKKLAIYLAIGVTVASGATALAAQPSTPEPGQPSDANTPFAATEAAANGREVPAQVADRFQDRQKPRVLGADKRGQEYALSAGTAGSCLIAVRSASQSGFEACAPSIDRDLTTMVYLGNGRIRTVVLQAHATGQPPARLAGGERVAPGLWVSESAGELPGG